MSSEKGDVPGTVLTRDHVGEQNAGRRDINSIAPHYPIVGLEEDYPIVGGSTSTSGHVYAIAYDRSADRGIPHYTPRPNNTTAAPPPYTEAPPPYPGRGPPAHDRPGMQSNVVVVRQPGPRIINAHPDPGVEAEYDNLLWISICLWCCCSLIIGIIAIFFSLKARKAARLGLMDEAQRYASCAKGWMTATVIVGLIFISVVIIAS